MKRVQELVELFRENGFTLLRNKNHQIWGCPCGHALITASGSPCGGRGGANTAAQIKRTLRACDPERTTTP